MNGCTIIARNYLPQARVLARSFFEFNPAGSFTALVIDDRLRSVDPGDEPFDVLTLADIGIPEREIHNMAMIYDVMELATSAKPFLLRHLINAGSDHAVYFDPDIQIFAPLDEIEMLSKRHGILLTPHELEPMPRDGKTPDEYELLKAGVFNLGFIGVGASARPFLDWWCERLARDCVADPENSLFVDQKWIDFVPTCFSEYHVHRDAGCNVAYWNLDLRSVVRTKGEEIFVNGSPLKFFHFSGYDPNRPHWLSKFLGTNSRILLSENALVAELCDEYGKRLLNEHYDEAKAAKYGWSLLPDGTPIGQAMRKCYREELLSHELGRSAQPPDPFDDKTFQRFIDWLNEAPEDNSPVSRLLWSVWRSNKVVRSRFNELRGDPALHFLSWIRTEGWRQTGIDVKFTDIPTLSPFRRQIAPPSDKGVNVVGYFRAESGIGEVGRTWARILGETSEKVAAVEYRFAPQKQQVPFSAGDGGPARYDVNLICVNADQLPHLRHDAGPALFEGRYTIGAWYWEVDVFPEEMQSALQFVDEVWVSTDHVAQSIRQVTTKPVRIAPHPMDVPDILPPPDKNRFGLEGVFTFLFTFDLLSVPERKNPKGTVEAFRRAFGDDPSVLLLIKTNNSHRALEPFEDLLRFTRGMSNVRVFNDYVGQEERDLLIASCDCFVSLHRAEGLGLALMEAMALGKPVIATGYSGNLSFMNANNSYLVSYVMIPVGTGNAPYPPHATWAEPDLDEAARLMRQVYEDPAAAKRRGALAREDIRVSQSRERSVQFAIERLQAIRTERKRIGSKLRRRSMKKTVRSTAAAAASSPPGQLSRRVLRRVFRPELERIEDRYRDQGKTIARLSAELEAQKTLQHEITKNLEARITDLTSQLSRVTDTQGLQPPTEPEVISPLDSDTSSQRRARDEDSVTAGP